MWEVLIRTEAFQCKIYIFREVNANGHMQRHILRIHEDGSTHIDVSQPDFATEPSPTMSFSLRDRGILEGLAGQLAQLGFGALSATPVVNAQAKHIDSLEKQADRLMLLAQVGMRISQT